MGWAFHFSKEKSMDNVIIDFSDFKTNLPSQPSPHRPKLMRRHQSIPIPSLPKSLSSPPSVTSPVLGLDYEMNDLLTMPLMIPILEQYEKIAKAQLDPIIKDINAVKRYRRSPLLFWRDVLGISIDVWRDDKPPKSWKPRDPRPLWSKQREIIQALVDYRKVAVKAGLGTGKTFVAGGLSLYLAYVWHCIGLTTASTFRQVRRALWGEIHWFFNNAREPLGGNLNQVSLDLGDKWFVEGFATDKPMTNITGIHEENIFVIVDEAHGVPDLAFEAFEGIVTSENTFVLYIGNAINPSGRFADTFKPKSTFHHMTISCYDVPNVKHAQVIYPKLTTYQWVKDKETKWPRDSALFKGWVLGEFPEESKDSLIPIHYIDLALRKGQNGEVIADRIKSFGLDVARKGPDSTVYGVRYDSGLFQIIEVANKNKETETAGKMKIIYDTKVPKLDLNQITGKKEEKVENHSIPPINVDDLSVGGGVVDILEEDEYPVNGINVGELPDLNDEESDHPELFLNKRAQYYWKVRMAFINERIAIEDEELALELSHTKVEYLRSGKIKIVDKDKIKLELKRSPDRAECCMLAWAKSEAESNQEMVRFIS
jgi:hypothetical protein